MDIEELNRILAEAEQEENQPPKPLQPQPAPQQAPNISLSVEELRKLFAPRQEEPEPPKKPKKKPLSKKKLEALAKARETRAQKARAKQTGQVREYNSNDIEAEVQKRVFEILEQYQAQIPQQAQMPSHIPLKYQIPQYDRQGYQYEDAEPAPVAQLPQAPQRRRLQPMQFFQAPVEHKQVDNIATRHQNQGENRAVEKVKKNMIANRFKMRS